MTRLAIACVRLTNPRLRVLVTCDAASHDLLRTHDDPLIEAADEWIAVRTPPGPPQFRNRFVKTSIRESVDGPLLLVDSDIVVRGDVAEIFSLKADIACARNHSRGVYAEQLNDRDLSIILGMDWTINQEVYLNAGVVFLNDTPGARKVASEWHRLWLLSHTKFGDCKDQPAFNAALHRVSPKSIILSDKYNAQIKKTPSSFYGARIWHYYAGYDEMVTNAEVSVAKMLRGSEEMEASDLVASPHPWRCDSLVDRLAVYLLNSSNNGERFAGHLLRGQVSSYFASRLLALARAFEHSLPYGVRSALRRRLKRPLP